MKLRDDGEREDEMMRDDSLEMMKDSHDMVRHNERAPVTGCMQRISQSLSLP